MQKVEGQEFAELHDRLLAWDAYENTNMFDLTKHEGTFTNYGIRATPGERQDSVQNLQKHEDNWKRILELVGITDDTKWRKPDVNG